FQSGVFRLPGVQSAEYLFGTWGGNKRCAGEGIVDTFATRPVGEEQLPILIETQPPRVHKPFGINIQFERMGLEFPHPAPFEPSDAPRGFHVAVDINRLVEIQPSLGAPAEGMDQVVGITGSEAVYDCPSRICFTI